MKKFKKPSRRPLSAALVLAFMLALPLSPRAAEAPAPEATPPPSSFVGLSLRKNSRDGYLFHTKNAYQWIFGFNKAYDTLSPMVGCFYDTMRFEFNYGGRDWLLQAWKGTYGYGLYTGGEIGLYSKSPMMPVKHYMGATTKDWIGIEFSIYHYQNKLFTRLMENTWWVTGFKQYITSKDFARDYLIMEAKLRFQSEGMAAAFAQAMADKGFAPAKGNLILDRSYTTERYTLSGSTVCFLWRLNTDG